MLEGSVTKETDSLSANVQDLFNAYDIPHNISQARANQHLLTCKREHKHRAV